MIAFSDSELLYLHQIMAARVNIDEIHLRANPHFQECPDCKFKFEERAAQTLALYNKIGEFVTC